MRSLFVMDPLDRIVVAGDSTYVTMRECTDRDHPIAYCTPADLFVRDGRPCARAAPIRVTAEAPYFHPQSPADVPLDDFDVVWMRKDPPFDMQYVLATYVLDMVGARTLVVNHPAGLQRYNEKLWAMHFARFQPDTLISSDQVRLREFVEATPGRAVLKPWDGNGGRGVLVTRKGDRNLRSMIEVLTGGGRDAVIAQAFIEGIDQGDKRILLFDGEPVGAMLRIPSAEDFRGNMHVGARVAPCELTPRDVEICQALGPALKDNGMVFVGIDVIAGFLTEINVTSPTGIREINALHGTRLEADLVDTVARRLSAWRTP